MRPLRIKIIPGDWIDLEKKLKTLTKWVASQPLTPISYPTFAGLTLTGLTGILKAAAGAVSGSAVHTDLGGVTANQHHNQIHQLDGSDHTVSGLTPGHILKALTATTFGFAAPGFLVSETDPLSLHLDQASPQTFANLGGGTGLMKITAGLLGLDTNAYYKSGDSPTFANITDSGLTITRIPYASTSGLLVDSSNLTFDGTNLTNQGYGKFLSGVTLDSTAPSITGGFFRCILTNPSTQNPVSGYFSLITTRNSTGGAGLAFAFQFENSWNPLVGATSAKTTSALTGARASLQIKTDTGETKNMTVTNGYGYYSKATTLDGSGASGIPKFTTLSHFYADTSILSALGAIGTCYAFYDAGQAVGTQVTTPWGLGINTKSYINANLSIGKNTAPAYPIDCVGDISSSTAFRIGATLGLGTAATPLVIVTAPITALGATGTMTFIGGILTASTPAT
jgi:hypothetical protein